MKINKYAIMCNNCANENLVLINLSTVRNTLHIEMYEVNGDENE